jgi:hypothetical protein
MATDLKNENDQSVTSLVGGIVQDAQELLKQQFELLKHEVRTDVGKLKTGAQVIGAGAAIGVLGSFLLSIALALGLQTAVPALPLWACFAILGGIFLVVGGGLYAVGLGQIQTVHPLSDETGEALKENVQWITNRK